MEKFKPTDAEFHDENGSNNWTISAQNQKKHQDYDSFKEELAYWKARIDQAFSLPVAQIIGASETDCQQMDRLIKDKNQEKIRFEFNDAVLDYMEAHDLKAWEITDALRN